MKTIVKTLLGVVLSLCLLAVPFAASAEETPLDLMPTSDASCTIVEGDGTVSVADGVLTIVNNGDGDLRVTIDNPTVFDASVLNTLHMEFNAGMPFKMAYYLISDDGSSDWLNTSTDYMDVFTVDVAADRVAAGEYTVDMNIGDRAVDMTGKTAVHYDQFIILMTGKGTFTMNAVQMVAGESEAPAGDGDEPADTDTTTTDAADEDTTTTEAAADEDTTTTAKPKTTTTKAPADDADDEGGNDWLPIVLIVAVVVVVAVVVIVIVKKRKA